MRSGEHDDVSKRVSIFITDNIYNPHSYVPDRRRLHASRSRRLDTVLDDCELIPVFP